MTTKQGCEKCEKLRVERDAAKRIIEALLRDGMMVGSCSFTDGDPDLWQCMYCRQKGKRGTDFCTDWCPVGNAIRLFDVTRPTPDCGEAIGLWDRAEGVEEKQTVLLNLCSEADARGERAIKLETVRAVFARRATTP